MNSLHLLRAAREALIEGRPDDALAAMNRFHALGVTGNSAMIPETLKLLEELADLSEAGRQGVASARQGFSSAVELATGVATYDRQGQRAHAGADRRKPMRF